MIKHICLGIDGAIINSKTLKGCIMVDNHTLNTVGEIRDYLKSQKKKGYEVLPMGYCNNFDFKTGCKGHETKEECEKHETICKIAEAICKEKDVCKEWCGTYINCKAYQEAKKIYEGRT